MVQEKNTKTSPKNPKLTTNDAVLASHKTDDQVRVLLIELGVESFKKQAGKLPGKSDFEILPVTTRDGSKFEYFGYTVINCWARLGDNAGHFCKGYAKNLTLIFPDDLIPF